MRRQQIYSRHALITIIKRASGKLRVTTIPKNRPREKVGNYTGMMPVNTNEE